MTADEIARERANWLRALADPTHEYHSGAHLLAQCYRGGDAKTRTFFRQIAPYAFDADGQLLTADAVGQRSESPI